MVHAIYSDYKEWLITQGYSIPVANTYVSKLRSLLNQLFTNGYTPLSKAESVLNDASTDKVYMQGILQGLNLAISRAFADPECRIAKGLKNDGRSSFRKFVEYVNLNLIPSLSATVVTSTPLSVKAVSRLGIIPHVMPKETLKMMGWEDVSHKSFYKAFKNRLVTQGRESGGKIWLSIRLVNYILGKKWFDEWSKSIYSRTKVFTDDNGTFITLDKVMKFVLRPSLKGNRVDAVLSGSKAQIPVFTRTKTGELIQMTVSKEADISIEHVKAIDTTLRERSSELVELTTLSQLLKTAPRDVKGDYNLYKWVKEQYTNIKATTDSARLINEMEVVKDDTEYELMHRSFNSSKGSN